MRRLAFIWGAALVGILAACGETENPSTAEDATGGAGGGSGGATEAGSGNAAASATGGKAAAGSGGTAATPATGGSAGVAATGGAGGTGGLVGGTGGNAGGAAGAGGVGGSIGGGNAGGVAASAGSGGNPGGFAGEGAGGSTGETGGAAAGGAGGIGASGGAATGGTGGDWTWPEMLDECADATDEHLLAVVYDGPQVPEGMYDGDGYVGGLLSWNDACASDFAAARVLAENDFGAWTSERDDSPYYYEFLSGTGTDESAHRVTKCEFFDGSVLGESYRNPDGVQLLASYLWFIENRFNGSAKVVAGAFGPNAARYDFFLCHTMTVYGDWGLYDEITYYERSVVVELSGAVTIAADQALRTIQGQYTPSP